jgi:hypothetical protein
MASTAADAIKSLFVINHLLGNRPGEGRPPLQGGHASQSFGQKAPQTGETNRIMQGRQAFGPFQGPMEDIEQASMNRLLRFSTRFAARSAWDRAISGRASPLL